MVYAASESRHHGFSEEARIARRLLNQRRQRTVVFDGTIIDECEWEMMLDALIAREEGRLNTLSNICLATSAPAATAFRHLNKLIERDVLIRRPDPHDGRRAWVELNPGIEDRLRLLLQSWSLQDAAEALIPGRRCSCQRR